MATPPVDTPASDAKVRHHNVPDLCHHGAVTVLYLVLAGIIAYAFIIMEKRFGRVT